MQCAVAQGHDESLMEDKIDVEELTQILTDLSAEHVAITWPNSGWAHVMRQIMP
jgi:hypothetical protein